MDGRDERLITMSTPETKVSEPTTLQGRVMKSNKRDVLKAGDIIYLKKKRRHAEKAYKNRPHTIKVGESMYDIAQKYGIRLKSLYKMNHLSPDYQIKPGTKLRVY